MRPSLPVTDPPSRTAQDGGSVTAELALALPAVVLTLLLGVAALSAGARQIALQDATADAARLLGRGEEAAVAHGVIAAAVAGAHADSEYRGELVCVQAHADISVGTLVRIPIASTSCALSGGR